MAMGTPFTWGSKGRKMTPEAIERERALLEKIQGRAGDTSPVGHWLQGAGRVVDAITGKVRERRADASEKMGMDSADEYVRSDPVLSGLIGGKTGYTGAPVETGPEQGLADDVTGAIGKPSHDHAAHAGQSHSDWLQYSNHGATRNQPLNEKLVSALSFLPELGVQMKVVSGGQSAAGSGGPRTGSTRHDHGNAADADFYKDGRKLDWNNPDDVPVFQEIVRRARSNGVTGIGAGDDYMGAGRMHVGFGGEAVWGAGGSGANAPEWLRAAAGGTLGQSPQGGGMGSSGQPTPITGGGSGVVGALAQAMSDPWVAKKYGPVIQALMGQEMKRGDMQYQQQLAQSDPAYQMGLEKSQMEIDQMRNPAVDPWAGTQVINGQVVQMGDNGPEAIGDFNTPDPGYTMLTPEEAAAQGLPPGAYQRGPDNKISAVGGGGVTVHNDMGGNKIEEAFAKGDAATIEAVSNSGLAAQRNLGRIDQLEALLSASPTGLQGVLKQAAGEWGINTEGLTEIQAAQALINSLVPEQRQPGSGPMSDADLELFKQSLPRIINQPGGNEMILGTMRAIAQYDAEGAQIVQELRAGAIDRAEAFDRLQRRVNPLQEFKQPPSPSQGDAVPQGVDPADWKFMTPEQKAIFQ